MTDADPAAAARRTALEAMVRSDPHRLRRRSLSRGVPSADADDVAQDALLHAWRSIELLHSPEPGQMCSWLDTIARNAAYDLARRRSRQMSVPLDLDFDAGTDTAADVEVRTLLAGALRAIHDLPPELRDPLLLSVVDDLQGPEIAARLGVSPAAARQRVARARKALSGCRDTGMGAPE